MKRIVSFSLDSEDAVSYFSGILKAWLFQPRYGSWITQNRKGDGNCLT